MVADLQEHIIVVYIVVARMHICSCIDKSIVFATYYLFKLRISRSIFKYDPSKKFNAWIPFLFQNIVHVHIQERYFLGIIEEDERK